LRFSGGSDDIMVLMDEPMNRCCWSLFMMVDGGV
jgi:hypothetical protein